MKLKALIFDVDGTLADTEEAHRCAFNEAFRQLALDWNWTKPKYAELLATTGGKERLAAYIDFLPIGPKDHRRYSELIGDIHRAKTANFTRMAAAGLIPLREGVARLMEDAARFQVRLAIATTTTPANVEALLRANMGAGALDRFTVIGAGDQVERKKPAPDIYEYVLKALGLGPDDCAAIEDSANGLMAAKAAGLYTIVTPSYWTSKENFSAADLVIASLTLGVREIDRHRNAIGEHE